MFKTLLIFSSCLFGYSSYCQYSNLYVSATSDYYNNSSLSIINMSRKDEKIKVKYFAAKDGDNSVYDKFLAWKTGKNIIAYSSGTYMTTCESQTAVPVGLCIDNGRLVNNVLTNDLDALAIVYATGGMVASNLRDKDLTITYQDGTKKTINIREPLDRRIFIDWAKSNSATVFQTHLLSYKNQLLIRPGANRISNRRFIAVGKDSEGTIRHIIISILAQLSLYDASVTALGYINSQGILSNVTYMINIDPGCQNVFQAFKSDGSYDYRTGFSGDINISNASNLVVYYYEY